MDITLPNGAVIQGVPDGTSKAEIKRRAIAGGLATEDHFREINKPLQFFQKIAQGATFGFGDEISAAMVGGVAALTGGDFRDAYDFAINKIRADEDAFAAQNPKTAMGAEILGAIGTGGMAGGRLIGNTANMSRLGRTARIAGVGAGEGALYGAGTNDENRTQGALLGGTVGGIAAPIGAAVINGVLKGGRALASYGARKLADTPRSEAIRAIRQAAINEGLDADDAVRMLDELGPDATLADLGENFRFLARAATDQAGQFKTQARNLMNTRQTGQQGRLLEAAEIAAGQRSGNYNQARQALIQSRSSRAAPLYQRAFQEGIQETDELASILNTPQMQASLRKANRLAADEGIDVGQNLLQRLHYAKMDLDDKIGIAIRQGRGNQARILTNLKSRLLAEIDRQNGSYSQAREMFSGDTAMIRAMDDGADFFRMSPDDMAETVANMSQGEKDMFRLGAVRAIREMLENTNLNSDATRRLLGTQSVKQKLGNVFDNPDEFIQRAMSESEFTRTRNVLTGGSPTAERLAGQESLSGAIQPELIVSLAAGEPITTAAALLKVLTKNKDTPEVVEALADIMLQQGQSPEQIRRIFINPRVQRELGAAYNNVVLPAISGAIAPASQVVNQ